MTIELRVDSYEAGIGAVGGLSTFHNNLYPRLVNKGFDVKTFSMHFRPELPTRENFKGVIIRRPSSDVDLDVAYAWTYDVLHQYGIDVKYLMPSEIISQTSASCHPLTFRNEPSRTLVVS